MDLSAMQPGAPAAEGSIFAAFLPANTGSAAAQPGLFETLLEDALGLAAPVTPAVEASGESLATVDGNGAVVANAGSESNATASIPSPGKGGAHKKADFKGAGGDNAGTAALYALTMAPLPAEPLLKLDQTAMVPTVSSQAPQPQQNSAAQVEAVPATGAQPVAQPQPGATGALKEIAISAFQLLANAEVPSAKSGTQPEGQNIDSTAQELSTGNPSPKNAEQVEKRDKPNLESKVSDGLLSRNPPSNVESRSPVKQLPPLKMSEGVQAVEEHAVVAHVPDGCALTTIPPTAIGTASQTSGAAPPANPLLQVQAGGNPVTAADLLANAIANLVASAPQDPSSIAPSAIPVPAFVQPGKDAPVMQAPIVALPQAQPQPTPQTPTPTPTPQTQPQAQPAGMHYQHIAKRASQPAISGLLQGENPADLPKAAASSSTHVSATHQNAINSPSAGGVPLPKSDAAASPADSALADSTPVRDADRKSSPALSQVSPATPSAQATTPTPPPAQPVAAPATNPAPPAGVPAATSQPAPMSAPPPPLPRPTAHDLPAAMPAPAAPVQVSAARIVQTDSRAGMRLDMQTQSFGGVEVHTSIAGRDVQLSVSAEHGDLHSFLAPEMPVLQSQLQQHDLRLQQVRTVLNYGTQQEFSSGSGRQEQRFARPQTRPGAFDSQHHGKPG